ncbi:hypothetical protein AB3662_42215 [Sorangium cellulosum]|uniref:hypothetical protein n=1 Tax=Sorangium cellulosum TaxID=56 RepID=UPI003D9A4CE8
MTHSPLALSSRRGAALRSRVPLLLLAALATLAACGDGGGGGGSGAAGGGGGGEDGAGGSPVIEEPNRFRMRIDDAETPAVVLQLDRQKALQVFGEDGAKQITVLDVDTTGLLRSALEKIQDACGPSWRDDRADPQHNCMLNPVGQSFGAEWQTSPEFALVRLLTMTPANADVTGTSLEELRQIFDENPGLFSIDFADVLADSVNPALTREPDPAAPRDRTAPLVPIDKLILALQQQLLATHPAISDPEGVRMPITLYEALHDLESLDEKLGPAGAHPGVLRRDDESFTTKSDVIQPDFSMRVVAESGLRRVSGLDLSRGGGDMFLRDGDAPLRFDFNDEEKLQITGIAQNPTVDMRIELRELPTRVPSCIETPDCKANHPDMPVGTDTVWTVPPFLLESIVGTAAYLTYGDRPAFSGCYFRLSGTCRVGVDIGSGGEPLGWTVFNGNISTPPPRVPDPQFLWELLTEVAQVAIHDPTGEGSPDIEEGDAQPVFALQGVSIGLTGEQVIAGLRETLQGQAKQIAEIILGRYWVNNDALDFFYSRSEPGGAPYLYFVAEGDLRPPDQGADAPRAYAYDKPGFFTSPDLDEGSKVSKKDLDGLADMTHEKYRLPPGDTTLYMQDDEAAVYEVRFHVPDTSDPVEITADVKRL